MHHEASKRGEAGARREDVTRWLPAARQAVCGSIRAGMQHYRRERQLPGLIAVDPAALADRSVGAAQAILARLRRALRAERRRAKAGHWTYDLNRHIALRQAYAAELERFAKMKAGSPGRRS